MILARVQHHPSRAGIIGRLLAGLDPLDIEVISSDEDPPSPWLGYLACLRDLPSRYAHVLIIQDDAIVCRNFTAALERIIAAHPDVPICLFSPNNPAWRTRKARWYRDAVRRQHRYAEIQHGDFLPVVAVLWPKETASAFALWSETATIVGLRQPWRSDDAVGGAWMAQNQRRVLVTLPSLVEHPDDVPSVKGRKHHTNGMRRALNYIGDADPLDLDWAQV